ncbi:MAG: hypothetical protein FJ215_03290 [Ignavibacteria bacterium]|nr:hypothetical protein [Ignavibacteria bacterium]
MKRRGALWATILLVVITGTALLFLSLRSTSILPDSLSSLALVRHVTGDDAREFVDRLHGKGVSPAETEIGFYEGERGKATIYVSSYRRGKEAEEAYSRMVRLIEAGNPVFGHFQIVEIESHSVAFSLGLGRAHYFYVSEAHLFWLEADLPVASDTIRDLLRRTKGGENEQARVPPPFSHGLMFGQQFFTFFQNV